MQLILIGMTPQHNKTTKDWSQALVVIEGKYKGI